MRALLPMYDWPEVETATDAWWTAIAARLRTHGIAAPAALTRTGDLPALWMAPDLLLAQTCGLPFARYLHGRVHLVATPCYAADGCEGPRYRSWLVVRRGERCHRLADLRGGVAAINEPGSLSGWLALADAVDGADTSFAAIRQTGSHRASLAAVRDGAADVAAIDAVSLDLAERFAPDLVRGLERLAPTQAFPALPLITARRELVEPLRLALDALMADPALAAVRAALGLVGFQVLEADAYAPIGVRARELTGRLGG